MTKTLGLLRHAKSDWDDVGKRDFDRGLNERGRKGARLMGRYIRDNTPPFDLLLASPAERVKRTLETALPDMQPTWDDRLYLASSETLMETLRDHGGDTDAVLISAHNPGLQQLVFDLIPPEREDALFEEAALKYPTATFALFALDIDDWSQLAPDCGTLTDFKRPRDLDVELGPEG